MQLNSNKTSHLMKSGKTFFIIYDVENDEVFKFKKCDEGYRVWTKDKQGKTRRLSMQSTYIWDVLAHGSFISEEEYNAYGKESFMEIDLTMHPSLIGCQVHLELKKNMATGSIVECRVFCKSKKVEEKCPKYVTDSMTKESFEGLWHYQYEDDNIDILDAASYDYTVRLDGDMVSKDDVIGLEDLRNDLLKALAKWSAKLSTKYYYGIIN